MSLTKSAVFYKHEFIEQPTSIIRLKHLERVLELPKRKIKLFVKRDDQTPIGGGGNKTRKLEYHFYQAKARGATRIITTGGIQSNHARLTAACCAKEGIPCTLILSNEVPFQDYNYQYNGNVLLNQLFGAEVIRAKPGDSLSDLTQSVIEDYQKNGECIYFIPLGGSTALGCLGYVDAACEIVEQQQKLSTLFTHIYLANGSSGTQAGLVAGLSALQHPATVKGYAVLYDKEKTEQNTLRLTEETLDLLNMADTDFTIQIDDSQRGKAYGLPTLAMKDALKLLAHTEGLLLDPVYSGKAFAGLLKDLYDNNIPEGANILFIMTGGSPGIYSYVDELSL